MEKVQLVEKIQKKEAEIQALEDKLKSAKGYVQALKEVLALFDQEGPANETLLRAGSAMASAREAILAAGKPMHVDDLLGAIGKPLSKETRSSLGSALSAYVRREEIFTRPAPNTFGLIEMGHIPDKGPGEPPPGFGLLLNEAANAELTVA